MQAFAQEIGLTGRTGIELAEEAESFAAGQSTLYAPGEGQYTPIPAQMFQETCALIAEAAMAQDIPVAREAVEQCVERIRHMACQRESGAEWSLWRTYIAAYLEAIGFTTAQATDPALVDPIIAQVSRVTYNGSHMLETAIGQSITQVTPIMMARYMTAIANGGYVYPASVVEAILFEGGWLDRYVERIPERILSERVRDALPHVHQGLRGGVDYRGESSAYFQDWKYAAQVASMKGYGESYETGEVNSVWYAGFAPFDQPEIVVVVNLLDGSLGEDYAAFAGKRIFEAYLDGLLP